MTTGDHLALTSGRNFWKIWKRSCIFNSVKIDNRLFPEDSTVVENATKINECDIDPLEKCPGDIFFSKNIYSECSNWFSHFQTVHGPLKIKEI